MKSIIQFILFFVSIYMNAQNITFSQPDYLKQGDLILIVAPAGVVKQPEAIYKAKQTFESWGYKVEIGKNVFNNYHHFSATDEKRLEDMQWAIDHPKAKAIWCARGGYGSVRIIDQLDFKKFALRPKWMVGYSDFTVFHNKLHNLGFQTIHAPMPINFKEFWPEIKESMLQLKKMLIGELPNYTVKKNEKNIVGNCAGVLVGGNLTILENMIGTDTCFSTKGKILFIEEIGEHKYHIDRLLRALDRKGYFRDCDGLIVGDFTNIKKNSPSFGQTLEELVLSIVKKYKIPVLFDFPAGHENKNMGLFFGKKAHLKVTPEGGTLTFH
ncbi:S66 peptidase family protein [Wenyingzhuangia sp. IMCC45574]